MSPLPQRRKSAEELAKLRADLGIPSADTSATPAAPPPRNAPQLPASLAPPATAQPPWPAKAVRSLRRSERLPVSPEQTRQRQQSSMPTYRHTEEQLQEIRRLNAIHNLTPTPPDFRMAAAPFWWLIPAYTFAIAGIALSFPQINDAILPFGSGMVTKFVVVVVAELFALAFAGFIFVRRFYSRHHSAILVVIASFTLLLAFFHFFPNFQHGS